MRCQPPNINMKLGACSGNGCGSVTTVAAIAQPHSSSGSGSSSGDSCSGSKEQRANRESARNRGGSPDQRTMALSLVGGQAAVASRLGPCAYTAPPPPLTLRLRVWGAVRTYSAAVLLQCGYECMRDVVSRTWTPTQTPHPTPGPNTNTGIDTGTQPQPACSTQRPASAAAAATVTATHYTAHSA